MEPHRVLVVDDEPDIRSILCDVLENEGYVVCGAGNGREALELLRSGERPSLILLDLMMPVMDGWSFLRALRNDEQLAEIPVLVVSASADLGIPDEASAFVPKPIDLGELSETVARFCR